MYQKFKENKIEGNWIVQSTNYSLLSHKLTTYSNKIHWREVKNVSKLIKQILKKIIVPYSTNSYNIYITQSKSQSLNKALYYCFLHSKKNNEGTIIKLDSLGNIVNKAYFRNKNNKSVHINYEIGNCNITEITSFVNSNLKIVKSIVKKDQVCIGISFSSEIKIS